MRPSPNPLFAMIPGSVLARAKALADQFRAEERLKEFIWRHVLAVTGALVLLIALNIANGFTFGSVGANVFKDSPAIAGAFQIYGVVAAFGGLFFSVVGLMAWIAKLAMTRANPMNEERSRQVEPSRRWIWWLLMPLALLPAVFNALFSASFVLVAAGAVFVVALLVMMSADI